MSTLLAAFAASSVLAGCSSKGGGGGGGSLVPAAVVQALRNCTELRGIDFFGLLDAIKTEIQDDASLPIQVDLDGDGTDDLTVDGTIVFTSATGGTVDWSLSGALTGSGSATFEVVGASLSVTGDGSITGLDGCTFSFSIAVVAPLAVSQEGLDGTVDFTVTTADGTTLSGSLVFTVGDGTVQVTDVFISYLDENDMLIEVTVENFSFELPGFGGPPPMASGDIFFAAQGPNDVGDGDFELWSMNADGSNATQRTFNDDEDAFPAVSPDGSRVAFVRGPSSGGAGAIFEGELYLMGSDGTNVRPLTSYGDGTLVQDPAWSPDGSCIVFAVGFGSQRGIFVLDVDTPGSTPELLVDGNGAAGTFSPSFSSDGAHVAYAENGGFISVVDALTGAFEASLDAQFPAEPLFSPAPGDGRLVYVGTRPPGFLPAIYADDPLDADPEELLAEFDPDTEFPRTPAWSPDASQIIYVVMANDRDYIWTKDLASGQSQPIFGPHRGVGRPSWGPSRAAVVVAGGHLWETDARGGSLRRITREPNIYADAVFSPDADRIAFVAPPEAGSTAVELFVADRDGNGMRQLTHLGLGARVASPAWSADGMRLSFSVDLGDGLEPVRRSLAVDAANEGSRIDADPAGAPVRVGAR